MGENCLYCESGKKKRGIDLITLKNLKCCHREKNSYSSVYDIAFLLSSTGTFGKEALLYPEQKHN
jgi:hypothetical protein